MALKATQTMALNGTAPTFSAASVSDTMEVGVHHFAVYKNTGTQKAVTVVTPGTLENGEAYPDKPCTLPATTGELYIPLLPVYADPVTGLATVTMTPDATGVTVAVVRRP